MKMENKKFTAGFGGIAKAVLSRAVMITFVFALIFIGLLGDVEGLFGIFWLAVIGSAVWEVMHALTVEVSSDGIRITKAGKNPVFYGFDKWNISTVGKSTIRASMRKLDKNEDTPCKSFPKSTFDELTRYIRKRQEVYTMNRAAGVQMSVDDSSTKPEKSSADRLKDAAIRAAAASAAAAARNPYAKKNASAQAARTIPEKAIADKPANPAAEKPIETVKVDSIPVITETPKITETTKITATPEIAETPKITEIPGIADLPKTNDWSEFVSAKPKPSEHKHGEDFHKAVFYYPRRDIEERTERQSTISTLVTLALSIAVFLIAYIGAPQYLLSEALAISVVCVAVIGFIAGSKASKLHGMPSKLEVTENHFVVDNTRYRLGEMTSKSMTSPNTRSGSRFIRFGYSGKQIVCALGPCSKSGTNSDEYFSRYNELCDKLKEKGFKCV